MLGGVADTTPVALSSTLFGCTDGSTIGVGSEITVAVSASEAGVIPAVTLQFVNGNRAATTTQQSSPFVFSYQLQAGDTGPIQYEVTASGGVASASQQQVVCIAGTYAVCTLEIFLRSRALASSRLFYASVRSC